MLKVIVPTVVEPGFKLRQSYSRTHLQSMIDQLRKTHLCQLRNWGKPSEAREYIVREKGKPGLFQHDLPMWRSDLDSRIGSGLLELVRCSWMPVLGLDNLTSPGMVPDIQLKGWRANIMIAKSDNISTKAYTEEDHVELPFLIKWKANILTEKN